MTLSLLLGATGQAMCERSTPHPRGRIRKIFERPRTDGDANLRLVANADERCFTEVVNECQLLVPIFAGILPFVGSCTSSATCLVMLRPNRSFCHAAAQQIVRLCDRGSKFTDMEGRPNDSEGADMIRFKRWSQ